MKTFRVDKNSNPRMLISAVLVVLCALGLQAQTPRPDLPDTISDKALSVNIRTHNFFKDNEYFGEKVDGYTLPGFTFEPTLRFDYGKHLSLEAGVHLLHFWGADQYPTGIHYGIIPRSSNETSSLFRIKPFMRARLSFGNKINVVLGSIYNNQQHHLPTPLYNRELSYASDPEAGVQLMLDYKHFNLDLWLDWQQFSFRKSNVQEQFVFGLSAIPKPVARAGKCELSIPVHFLAQHQGGEFMTTRTSSITSLNLATGVDFRQYFQKHIDYLQFGCLLAGYTHTPSEEMAFKRGWGIYPSFQAKAYHTSLEVGWWYSGDFIPILGSPHFGNVSTNYTILVFYPMSVVQSHITYEYDKFKFAILQLEAGIYYYPSYVGHWPGLDPAYCDAVASFEFGIHIHFNPVFDLRINREKKE